MTNGTSTRPLAEPRLSQSWRFGLGRSDTSTPTVALGTRATRARSASVRGAELVLEVPLQFQLGRHAVAGAIEEMRELRHRRGELLEVDPHEVPRECTLPVRVE